MNVAQFLMQTRAVVRVYDSSLWRRNPLFAAFAGISFDDELAVMVRDIGKSRPQVILDAGCGTGIGARKIARLAAVSTIIGVDLSPKMLRYARAQAAPESAAEMLYVNGDAQHLPFGENEFDAIVCSGALHLFADSAQALLELARVLRPGGRLALSVFRELNNLTHRMMGERLERIIGVKTFSPPRLESLLEQSGISGVRTLFASRTWLIVSGRKKINGGV